MPPAITDRDRWLALALLLGALLLGYLLLVHPWWTVPMQETGRRVAELRERELRIRTQLQQAPQVQRELATHDELGQRPLVGRAPARGGAVQQQGQRGRQGRRHHHEADAQAGE